MFHKRRVPLAWMNLTHDLRRLLLAVSGIGFAVLLMFMQLGFRGALLDGTIEMPRLLNADLILVNRTKYTVSIKRSFSRIRLDQALGCPDLVAAYPLYFDDIQAQWQNPQTHVTKLIRVLGFNPDEPVFLIPEVQQQAYKLLLPHTTLFDRKSKSDFGHPQEGTITELAGQQVQVVGFFDLGNDFSDDGNLIMSTGSFSHYFHRNPNDVDIGLLKAKPGVDLDRVRDDVAKLLPSDVRVMTKRDYMAEEWNFWDRATPVGYIFWFGTAMGFVVGVIICYQILYADISDHLHEFATLKAMGYQGRYFMKVVLEEAVILSMMGFVPGLLVSIVLYIALADSTGLLMRLSFDRAFGVLILTVAMCVVSGFLTMRRVLSTDPAELF
jgi:putative ABC transport system permease protein